MGDPTKLSSSSRAGRADSHFRSREFLIHDEKNLHPAALRTDQSLGREYEESDDPLRPLYRRDRDRIVHSTAFRRLEYKTQVFLFREDDHYRTRLTHTLEVSQVARSVALALGLNESYVEALALAHDLGHPPFGHSGEDALRECLAQKPYQDHQSPRTFEHNAQALRVVEFLERRYPSFPGLNLSHELRQGLLKHQRPEDRGDLKHPPLEAQLVDIADSIAYNHHDLDDGLRSGLLDPESLEEVTIWREAREEFLKDHPNTKGKELNYGILNRLLARSIRDVIEESAFRLRTHDPASARAARAHDLRLVGFSQKMQSDQTELGRFLFRQLYRAPRVSQARDAAIAGLKRLFAHYHENPNRMRSFYAELAQVEGVTRAVTDYIAGMTDRYAEKEHRQVFDQDLLRETRGRE